MKRILIFSVTLLAVIITATFLFHDRPVSEKRAFEILSGKFMACLPEDLTKEQRKEVIGILDRFSQMAQLGKVEKSDQEIIKTDLAQYVQWGRIPMGELEHFMAKVSFLTYKSDPDANLPDGEIDHPLLNPESN